MKTPAENPQNNNSPVPEEFQDLPGEEQELMAALRQTMQQVRPNARFANELQQELSERIASPANPKLGSQSSTMLRAAFKTISWAGMALALTLGLAWIFQNTRPTAKIPLAASSPAPASQVLAEATPSPLPPAQQTDTPIPTAQPAPTTTLEDITNSVSSPYLPGDRLVLKVSLPDGPPQQTLYQLIGGMALNVDTARAKARQLGIEGHVYNTPSEGGGPILVVTDGIQRVLFLGSVENFFYDANLLTAPEGSLNLPPVDAQIQAAKTWLEERSLLDFPHHVLTNPGQPGLVQFNQILSDLPIYAGRARPVSIDVTINELGQVKRVESTLPTFQHAALIPLRSAAQAWQDIQNGSPDNFLASSPLEISVGWPYTSTVQTWGRRYPIGQPVQMFGYLEILQSAEPGIAPLITFNNYLLSGSTTSLLQNANLGVFLHLMGTLENTSSGSQVFKISGWQTSSFMDESLEGTLEFKDGKTYLVSADRGRLLLIDAPAELQTAILPGAPVNARGIVLEGANPQMDWMFIQTGSTGSGGGGGGAGFKELNLTGSPIPAPTVAPLPSAGERVDGLIGYPTMTIHQYLDGSTTIETILGLESTLPGTEIGGLVTVAQGAGLAGIEDYLRLPVRVWGVIEGVQNGKPILNVERFEPIYPGVHYAAFVGRYEAVTLDGQTVLRLTTQDNQMFILESSIGFGANSSVGRPGDLIIIEGTVFPDKSFAGYPVITESSASMVTNQDDMASYVIRSALPDTVIEEKPAAGRYLTINQVELVYYTPNLSGVGYTLPAAGALYIQPVWRFSGQYSDGTAVEILVQAAAPELLK